MKTILRRINILINITVCVLGILLIALTPVFGESPKKPLQVVTTLFPIYDFARHVGKDRVSVTLLLPPGVEAHTFEPKPSDIIKINRADVFVFTNTYMEPWADDLLKGISNKDLTVIDASQNVEFMTEDDHDAHTGQHPNRRKPEHHENDPHVWLDPGNAQIMVQTIAAELAKKDPAHREYYMQNAADYNQRLKDIDRRFKQVIPGCKQKTIVYSGHFAFGYFTRRYGLSHLSPYAGFSPNAEPTPKAITELIRALKSSKAKYIFHEELLDPTVGRVIAAETGAGLLLLNGAHNISKDALHKGTTFIGIMEDNLKKLSLGLECDENN